MLSLLLLLALPAHSELQATKDLTALSPDSLFANGIGAYQKGDFSQAGQHFKELLKLQPKNEIAAYNWGLAEAKQENWGWAVALFRRALYISPSFTSAEQALKMVLEKLPNVTAPDAVAGFDKFRTQFIRGWSWHFVFLIIILSMLLGGLNFIKYFSRRRRALSEDLPLPTFPYFGTLALVIFLFFVFTAGLKSLEFFEKRGTLITKSSGLRTGPSSQDTQLFEVFEGQELLVYKTHQDWVQVQIPGGLTGWLPQNDIFLATENTL